MIYGSPSFLKSILNVCFSSLKLLWPVYLIHRISRYRMRAWLRHRGPFLQIFCPYKISFKMNFRVSFHQLSNNQTLSGKFLWRGHGLVHFQKRWFCFSNKKSWRKLICPYNPPFCGDFDWHKIGVCILYLMLCFN